MLCGMAEGRLDIPIAIKRAVLVEAGHRCAIPTCRQWPIELAHIAPYRDVRKHAFENLIALCPTCHTRFDNTNDIDRKAMLRYKQNLGVLNGRYTDVERQLLQVFAERWRSNPFLASGGMRLRDIAAAGTFTYGGILIFEEMAWLLSNLLADEIVELKGGTSASESGSKKFIYLTVRGAEMVERILSGEPL